MPGFKIVYAVILTGLVLAGEAAAGSLDALMTTLADVRERRARFIEERSLGVLDEPLVTEGTFAYEAPDRLIRQDLIPTPALYVLDGDRLDIVVDGDERTLSLDQEPMIKSLIAPLRAVFAGDLETLEKAFDLGYADDSSGWMLTLKPKAGTPALQLLEAITVSGTDRRIARIETEERGGDRSVMLLETLALLIGKDG